MRIAWAALLLCACTAADSGGAADSAPGGAVDAASPRVDAATPTGPDAAPGERPHYLCDDAPPPGAAMPPPPPTYSGGECPAIATGPNTIVSGGVARSFILVAPTDTRPDEVLPLTFLWHPLGSSASVFLERGELIEAVATQRFLAVLPESKGDVELKWPVTNLDSEARVNEELLFFDDMVACVSAQLPVNASCLMSGGVSSGGLWTSQLAGRRSDRLASFISLSGGTGGTWIKPWPGASRPLPAFVLWGGEADNCFGLFSFVDTSHDLEENLEEGGHFMVECVHNCGHAIPPFDQMPGRSSFESLWNFGLNHPYWLAPGESPYLDDGLPDVFPDWCGIGAGSAEERTGMCLEDSQC